jgi:hypothetical protein
MGNALSENRFPPFETREAAPEAARQAIREEFPKYNPQ